MDWIIVEQFPELTRSQLQNRFETVTINGKKGKLSSKVVDGDEIELILSLLPITDILPEKMDFDLRYQDEETLVINKPQGMVVHPGAGNYTGTLVNGLLGSGLLNSDFNLTPVTQTETPSNLSDEDSIDEIGGVRPGIVHRLDKDTSGVLIVARNIQALDYYSSLFRKRKIQKYYIALVKGRLPHKKDKIESFFIRDSRNRKKFIMHATQGKKAVSYYHVLEEVQDFSFLLLFPYTGRTHQLRVHLTGIGFPILGDPLYARRHAQFPDISLMLHAYAIGFERYSDQQPLLIASELPVRFKENLEKLNFSLERIEKKLANLNSYFKEP